MIARSFLFAIAIVIATPSMAYNAQQVVFAYAAIQQQQVQKVVVRRPVVDNYGVVVNEYTRSN